MSPQIVTTLEGLTPAQLGGFFEGWPTPPSPETLHRMLCGSYRIALAMENEQVVGFAQAISDGVLTAFIPSLEVRPEWRGQGLGSRLMDTLLDQLAHLYAVDLCCDDNLIPFYERLGMQRGNAMVRRNYARQSGAR
ncbi:GNAT family N-acetyltransferase [Deinococcus puniceus]|uniref:Acetyltransferase n=1 Tax=Deinococcus puniceus TaxID=1182568 RepID=A0A172T8J6_9DEIO|nr:GNAT family N-acetyltransferase [Deinococcus puniceus]ANE43133.1 acetyltransferase [Deinococcus puniceus]